MVSRAGSIASARIRPRGQRVLIVAGVPLGTPGTTNMVRNRLCRSPTGRGFCDFS